MFWKGQHVQLVCSLLLLLESSLHRVEIRLVWYGENWTSLELFTAMEVCYDYDYIVLIILKRNLRRITSIFPYYYL
jgi:hypothetical protein